MPDVQFDQLNCPLPLTQYEHVLLGHGSGGKLSADLIRSVFLSEYGNELLAGLEDSASLSISENVTDSNAATAPRIAFTTDSFVVRPLFFPGGDIGRLAVHGTVNDLAVAGARPQYLSAAFIIEEGLPVADLRRIVASMHQACNQAQVLLVTGDTKVVDRGKGDGCFITTTGIGYLPEGRRLSVRSACPGDQVLVSGTIGDHGMAIMSVREGLEFETILESDTASLADLTRVMLDVCPQIRWMRDPTRGGVASTLNELAQGSRVGIRLDESALPVRQEVAAACELLGLDPMYVANEGKLIAVVPPQQTDQVLETMRRHPLGSNAAVIGKIVDRHAGMVVLKSLIGGDRVVTMMTGEQLPRIC